MPFQSANISSLIGGQMAMFSNQASFSQQIGGQIGTAGMGGAQPIAMQNPFPSYGTPGYGSLGDVGGQIAGSAGLGLPALTGGMSLAGGLMGGTAGWMDPFTGVARGFARGAGAGGMGFGATMGHVGKAFATGGLRAGAGVMAGGLAGAAAMALPYAAAGYAINAVGEQFYQGAQQMGDMGKIAEGFGPAYGTGGMRPGGKLPRAEIRQMVSTLEDLASEDVRHSVSQLQRLTNQFQSMGMLTGVVDAGTFKRRFTDMLKQVDGVAKVLGTTLEEAAPLLQSMRQTGLWTSKDIMGTTTAIKMVGQQNAPQMLGAMQAGAQSSWQMGGRLGTGAVRAREQFTQLWSGVRSGAISEEQIMGMTGGVGGAEGIQMVAGQNAQLMGQMGSTPMARLMMAGMGEFKEGAFTGRADEGLMRKFKSGQIDIGQLQSSGMGRAGTRRGAASFTANQEELSQEIMTQAGTTGVAQMIKSMMGRAGMEEGDEGLKRVFMQRSLGMSERQAKFWSDMIRNLPKMQETESRAARDAMEDAMRQMDERMNRSWAGVKEALGGKIRDLWRPVREAGADANQMVSTQLDRLADKVMGRGRGVRATGAERAQILTTGMDFGAAPDIGKPSLENYGGIMGTGLGGVIRRGGTAAADLKLMGATGDQADIEFAAQKAVDRTQYTSAESAGFTKPAEKANLNVLKQEMARLVANPTTAAKLRELKKEHGGNPARHMEEVRKYLKSGASPAAAGALEGLHRGDSKRFGVDELDALKVATGELVMPKDVGLNFEGMAGQAGDISMLSENERRKLQDKSLEEISSFATGGKSAAIYGGATVGGIAGVLGGAALGAKAGLMVGGAIGSVFTPLGTLAGGIIGGAVGLIGGAIFGGLAGGKTGMAAAGFVTSSGYTGTELQDVIMNPEWGLDFGQFTQDVEKAGGDITKALQNKNNGFVRAINSGDDKATKLLAFYQNKAKESPEERKRFAEAVRGGNAMKIGDVYNAAGKQTQGMAKAELGQIGSMGLSVGTTERYKRIMTGIAGSKDFKTQQGQMGDLQTFAEGLTDPEAGKLGGGQFGAQIKGFRELTGFKGETDAAGIQKLLEKVSKATGSTDIPGSVKADVEEMLKGDKKIDVSEMGVLRKKLGETIKRSGTETAAGAQSEADVKQQYIQANLKFVSAVTASIVALSNEKSTQATVDAMGKLKEMSGNTGQDTAGSAGTAPPATK